MSQTERGQSKRNAEQSYCNACGRSTNHDLIAANQEEYDDGLGDENVFCYDKYEMLKCRGCGSVVMRVTSKHIEDTQPRVIHYPPAIARRAPSWVIGSFDSLHVPIIVFELMNEVYTAVQNNLLRLASMGIRTTLEYVMRGKVGAQPTFKKLVLEFQSAGYLSERQVHTLDLLLEAGHATIHRGWEPGEKDIATLLDMTESIVETAYLHEWRAKDLDKRVPKRPNPP